MPDNVVPIVRALNDPELDRDLVRDAVEYLKARGVARDWAISCGVGFEIGKRKDVRVREGALAFVYLDHDGKATPHIRWRLRDESGFQVDGPKFIQRAESGVHAYMPPLRHKTLRMSDVLSDPKHALAIAEGET